MINSEPFDDDLLAMHPIIDFEYHHVQFTDDELDAISFTCHYMKAIASNFASISAVSFASGEIPSWFRQDLSSEEVLGLLQRLVVYPDNAVNALFKLDALTAIHVRKLGEAASLHSET